jgi:hypothetical protein
LFRICRQPEGQVPDHARSDGRQRPPNNAWQLVEALDKAGKYYESRFLPNSDHSFGAAEIHWDSSNEPWGCAQSPADLSKPQSRGIFQEPDGQGKPREG